MLNTAGSRATQYLLASSATWARISFNCSNRRPHRTSLTGLASHLLALQPPEPDRVTDRDRHKSREGPGADAAVSEEKDEKSHKSDQPEISAGS